MKPAILPPNEPQRLQCLQNYHILDTAPTDGFDTLTELAALVCHTPIALVSLVDEHRQWFKARVGLTASETPRDLAFCAHAILQSELFVVADTWLDERFCDHPLVLGAPHIRFYAGMPLVTADGMALGTLCVIDQQPRTLDPLQQQTLRVLAKQVVAQMELHRQLEERHQAEVERQRLDEILRLQERAIAASRNGIVITDARLPDNPVIYVNPSFERITGYTAAEVLGRNCRFLQQDDHDQPALEPLRQAIAAGQDCTVDMINYRKDGEKFWNHLSIAPIRDPEGHLTHFVGIQTDISDRKQSETQLHQHVAALEQARQTAEAANHAKGDFLAMMSHEIRTPLNAVIGMTGLLLDTPLTEQQRDFVETTRTAGDTLLTIINEILDFSKIESGKLDLETQPFNLRTCLEEALDLLSAKATEKNLELAYLIPPTLPLQLLGDVSRLRQVLVNLINNAIKFTAEGEVVVSVAAVAPPEAAEGRITLKVAVQDTGIGIPADRLDRLFQPFSQVDASTTRKFGGTGLGLAISKRLCELMGGTLWVESTEGQGSTFYFTLQLEIDPHPPQTAATAPDSLQGRRILVVDDNATNRQILELQLRAWGVEVVTLPSGAAALAYLEQNHPCDLAILDMQMPEMDGLTLAQTLRQRWPHRTLPLVMLTSLGWSQTTPEQSLFAASLTKPVKEAYLRTALASALAGQRQPVRMPPSPRPTDFDAHLAQRFPQRILLAEDNIVNQKVALQILQRLGYRADLAANGLEVLAALAQQPYDLVLLDVQMPEMDGLQATRQIHRIWPHDRPYLVAMTANAMQGDRTLCLQAGMDDYISKPIRLEELVRVLSRAGDAPLAPSAVSSAPALDLAALREFAATLGNDSSDFFDELVGAYLTSTDELLAAMKKACHPLDRRALHHVGHTLKSSSATVSATELASLCRLLEAEADQAPLDELVSRVDAIAIAVAQVTALLQSTLEN